MSVHNFTLEFSALARSDVDDILLYTLENWGGGQLAEYKEKLENALDILRKNPCIGSKKELSYRSFSVGRYCIFYRIDDEVIYIVRILHNRMDFFTCISL
jgi:toxin ParE1/3/4